MLTIQELLEQNGISTAEPGNKHFREGWLNIECPFCEKGSGNSHLGINTTFNYSNCYRCGPKSLWKVFSEILPERIKRDLRGLIGELRNEAYFERSGQERGILRLPDGLEKLSGPHKRYLKRRGLNYREVEKLWHIQGIAENGLHLSWRIFIPVESNGKVISWTTRALGKDVEPRYRACPVAHEAQPVKSVLFGEDYAGSSIIIHEGAFDVFTVGPGAVATMGTGYSRMQLLRMSAYPRRFVCFDNEPQAQLRARKLCRELESFPGQTENIEVDAKDMNEASEKEIRLIRKLIGR